MKEDDIPDVLKLQKRTFPGMAIWKAGDLRQHLKIFPEGQLLVVDEHGQVLGSSSSLLIDWDDYAESAKWANITGHGKFNTHNPLGRPFMARI